MSYPRPTNERHRLSTLKSYTILESGADPALDRMADLASQLAGMPIALITLVDEDRQWFKSRVGIQSRDTPRSQGFCSYTILTDEPFIVTDAARDPRFAHHPLVAEPPCVRFYAGFPLIMPEGMRLGSLCVMDTAARDTLPDGLVTALARIRDLAALHIDRHYRPGRGAIAPYHPPVSDTHAGSGTQARSDDDSPSPETASDRARREFFQLVSHELHTPLNGIIAASQLIGETSSSLRDCPAAGAEITQHAEAIRNTATHLAGLIDRIVTHASAERGEIPLHEETVPADTLLRQATVQLTGKARAVGATISFVTPDPAISIVADQALLLQALVNLALNALCHAGPGVNVRLDATMTDDGAVRLTVRDDGPGISRNQTDDTAAPLAGQVPVNNRPCGGPGLGLPITERLIELHGGRLSVNSAPGNGTEATVHVPPYRTRRG